MILSAVCVSFFLPLKSVLFSPNKSLRIPLHPSVLNLAKSRPATRRGYARPRHRPGLRAPPVPHEHPRRPGFFSRPGAWHPRKPFIEAGHSTLPQGFFLGDPPGGRCDPMRKHRGGLPFIFPWWASTKGEGVVLRVVKCPKKGASVGGLVDQEVVSLYRLGIAACKYLCGIQTPMEH